MWRVVPWECADYRGAVLVLSFVVSVKQKTSKEVFARGFQMPFVGSFSFYVVRSWFLFTFP